MITVYWRIALFFGLSYAFTWFGNLGNWLLPSSAWPVPMMPLGPLVAVLVVLSVTEGWSGIRAWLSRILRFQAPLWVYATSFFVPLAIVMVSAGLAVAVGVPHGQLPSYTPLEYLLYIPLVLVDGPTPEEISFRGYGQHELQRGMSPLTASLFVGLGVLIWHLPVLIGGYIPWPIAITLIAVSVVYAWLYTVGGSIWPLVILHFVQNYFGGGLFGTMFAEQDSSTWLGFLTVFYIGWAGFLVWRFGPSLGGKAHAGAHG